MKVVGAGKFKAKCLALLDEVAKGREVILVTKRGKPVAKVIPITEAQKSLREQLKGSILKEKDLVSPVSVSWEANS
jgi:prevent-host-death family protein